MEWVRVSNLSRMATMRACSGRGGMGIGISDNFPLVSLALPPPDKYGMKFKVHNKW